MKTDLKGALVSYTLGFYNYLLKPLQLWTSELSRKFRYQLSYSQLEPSSGQMPTLQMLQTHQALEKSQECHVFQDIQTGQPAVTSKTTEEQAKNRSQTKAAGLGTSFSEVIDFKRIKLRLFNGLYSFWENKRLRWGIILLMIVAPSVRFAYLLFPVEGFGEYLINTQYIQIPNTIEGQAAGWYWDVVWAYVFSNGELLAPVISMVGIFFLFPRNYYPSYIIGIPFGYYLSLSIHRLFFVDSYETFHSGWSVSMTLMFLIMGVIAFVISDKMLFQKNHVKRAYEARIVGLINMPGMEWGEKEELIKKETKELMKIDNELFIKESA